MSASPQLQPLGIPYYRTKPVLGTVMAICPTCGVYLECRRKDWESWVATRESIDHMLAHKGGK